MIPPVEMIEKSGGKGLIKCTCAACGYTVRTAEKWIQTHGAPHCPDHGAMTPHWPMEPYAVAAARLEMAIEVADRPRQVVKRQPRKRAKILRFPARLPRS